MIFDQIQSIFFTVKIIIQKLKIQINNLILIK